MDRDPGNKWAGSSVVAVRFNRLPASGEGPGFAPQERRFDSAQGLDERSRVPGASQHIVSKSTRRPMHAAFATTEGYDIPVEIEKRKAEADILRPRLAGLANRSTDVAPELNAVERYMGEQPSRLFQLIELVVQRQYRAWIDMLAEYEERHAAVEDALDRALEKLRA